MIYQTQKTVFDHMSKYQEESSKFEREQSMFDFEVFGNVVKHSLVAKHNLECLIYLVN